MVNYDNQHVDFLIFFKKEVVTIYHVVEVRSISRQTFL